MITTSKSAPRWVVITPSTTRQHWVEAVHAGAKARGLTVASVDGAGEVALSDIVLTDDAFLARDSGASEVVVLVPDPWTAAEAIGLATGGGALENAAAASRQLAQALDLADRHRGIGSDMMRTLGADFEIYPDLTVKIPALAPPPSGSSQEAVAAKVLGDLFSSAQAKAVSSSWPMNLFNHHQRSLIDGQLGKFDITGRPRFLVTGPYLCMPKGAWTAKIGFSVDEDASRKRFRVDWGGVEQWTEQHFVTGHAGVFEIELGHVFSQVEPCEFRLVLVEGSFAGHVDLISVTISRS